MKPVADDPELFELLLSEDSKQDPIWRATRYWAHRMDAVTAHILKHGIGSFRSDPDFLSSFGTSRPSAFLRPRAPELNALNEEIGTHAGEDKRLSAKAPTALKKFVARRLLRIWPFSAYYRRLRTKNLAVLADRYFLTSLRLLREAAFLSPLAADLMRDAADEGIGGPTDLIGPPGHRIGHDGLMAVQHLARIRHGLGAPPRSILEIGGGYGALCQMSVRCFKSLERYVLLDLPQTSYLSTQYLKAAFGSQVLDLRDAKPGAKITAADFGGKKIWVLPSWRLADLSMPFDIFVNTASFQEMEMPVIHNYMRHVSKLAGAMYLWNYSIGHTVPFESGPVTLDTICEAIQKSGYVRSSAHEETRPDRALEIFDPLYVSRFFKLTGRPASASTYR